MGIFYRTSLLILGCAAVPAIAQAKPSQSALIDALAACSALADDAKRLACYDPAVKALADAGRTGELVVMSREDVRTTKRSLFGFSIPSLPFFRNDDKPDEGSEEIELTIKAANPISFGAYTLSFEDGSVWQTSEAVIRPPKMGQKVTIKRGALGSYFMKVAGRFVRGRRVK